MAMFNKKLTDLLGVAKVLADANHVTGKGVMKVLNVDLESGSFNPANNEVEFVNNTNGLTLAATYLAHEIRPDKQRMVATLRDFGGGLAVWFSVKGWPKYIAVAKPVM